MTPSLFRRARAPGAALLLFLLPAVSAASQAIRLDVERLAIASDQIVIGKVASVSSRWTGDGRLIVTDVRVSVSERLKGDEAPTVTIVQPGGVVGAVGQKIAGMPRFRQGDEVVLFLERQAPERYVVTGMAQGKFRVERSSDGRSAFAVPDDLPQLGLVDPPVPFAAASGSEITSMPLETLRTKVQAALRGGPAEP